MQLDPIFTGLLQNNELPSEANCQEAIQLRSETRKDLLDIDTEIQRLIAKLEQAQSNEDRLRNDAELQRLQARRERLQRSLDIYNTILSPARRLLPDILREIFNHCVDQTYPNLSATGAPMLLTRISSLWRSVALSSPRIWTRLHIPLPGDPRFSSDFWESNDRGLELRRRRHIFSKTLEVQCQAVKEWLDRSGSLPLSLSISYPSGYLQTATQHGVDGAGEEEDEIDPLFGIIQPFAPRWRHLHLSIPLYIYQKLERKITLDSLSMLRYLNIHLHHLHYPRATQPTVIPLYIIELPSLEKLSLNCLRLTTNLGQYRNFWKGLTDICFESPVTEAHFLEMLRQCHNLISLDVNIASPWVLDSSELNLTMVVLPHLESLKVRETGSPSRAISAVNAPSVKLLEYRCPDRYANYDFIEEESSVMVRPESLVWLISNAAASLQTLSIDPHAFESEHILECLRLAIHVKELIFGPDMRPGAYISKECVGYEPDPFDLEAFTVRTTEYDFSCPASGSIPLQSEILLPNLESLDMNDSYIIAKITDETLRRILTSRIDAAQRGMTSPLRRVKIRLWRQKEIDIVPEILARAHDVGIEMKLDLLYRPSAHHQQIGEILNWD
ncbi:hypothetical protein M413DRAFT_27799 [Hebeloma cylindrosporum]|uniref:F-box domain-containing protein n=1 Tax=Hebeloma cylindrosporum TaxID=76867 RepID=A0A0C3BXZ0_HEBCY|nr:hypothetical protein M413DRAFT_27799 [Hebeloma cylindrosporum h7]